MKRSTSLSTLYCYSDSLQREQFSANGVQMAAVSGILMTCFLNDRRSLNLNLPSVTVNIFDRQMIGTLQKYWLMSTSNLASEAAVWSLPLRTEKPSGCCGGSDVASTEYASVAEGT